MPTTATELKGGEGGIDIGGRSENVQFLFILIQVKRNGTCPVQCVNAEGRQIGEEKGIIINRNEKSHRDADRIRRNDEETVDGDDED